MSSVPGDLDVYVKQGFGLRVGFGARPALLIIDFINAFNNPEQLGGGNIQEAIDNTAQLLALARHLDLPIAFTSHVYAEDGSDDNVFLRKLPGTQILRPGMLGDRNRRRARAAPRRAGPSQALPVGVLRDRSRELADGTRRGHRHRHRLHDLGLRPGHGGRRHVPRVSSDRSQGVLRRPRDRPARGEPVRHGSEVCGRHAARRGQGRTLPADPRPVGTPERRRLTAPHITCSACRSVSFAFE